MTGLDCNILIQLALADHPANSKTRIAVETELSRGEKLVFPSLVATEFLHVITDAKRFAPPLSMEDAIEWLKDFLDNPFMEMVEPTISSLQQTMNWMKEYQLGRKRILDTHLAAVLQSCGVRRLMTSNPRDFSAFIDLQIIAP